MTQARQAVVQTTDYLSHRKPFLFVDHAEIGADGMQAWGVHAFTPDAPCFDGHFPGDPIVPGVVLVEMLAQTANLLLSHRAGRALKGYLVGVEDARFNHVVRPPADVMAEVRLLREVPSGAEGGRIVTFRASAHAGGKRCMRGTVNIYTVGEPGAPQDSPRPL
ncbi:3-hydroxyacyl-[acyl-carrier-protein] dehydratase, FabZ form [plant metagenome]|uniref:3-hydroxyacyl-[acyl-carrier-protein] dehydratase, FabZ form n=1 Tax=plant metagenome TaxID=1297885 RepID=A0A484QTH5_9ZZZZ